MTFDIEATRRICECFKAIAAHGPLWEGDVAAFVTHARTALPLACNVIEALCEMLDDIYVDRGQGSPAGIDWSTIALARKRAKEGKGSTVEEKADE